ncbi:EF-hand domain-containing protein [Streptomyces phytohabitans]|uniref:EF-hand domain-containing protein n=1 Tax=Streptomyces phytohabitans TaxID=1150371 RepID=UPI00345B8DD3
MASEFQRNKIQAMFQAFDTDDDGRLDEADFDALAARWHELPRVAAEPELAARVDTVVLGWWRDLSAAADTNGDGNVDLDEILAMVDRLPDMRDAVTATADALFDAVDENADHRISRAEHQRLVDTWHGRSTATGDVFTHLDQDGDGHLSRPEFATLWTQFWISDDPTDPGNLTCGPLPATPRPPDPA